MSAEPLEIKVFRFDPEVDREPYYKTYQVPFEANMSAMDALDYIYQNLDGTLAYYDHAGCALGICGRCAAKINGRAGLLCQTRITGNTVLEPLKPDSILKDLVMKKEAADPHEAETKAGANTMQDINSVPILIRREIEALIAAPLLKAFIDRFGREPVLDAAGSVIQSLAKQAGELLKMVCGGNGMEHLQKALPLFSRGGALEIEIVEATPEKTAVNVTRCKYAEMYKEHGLEEFGFLLSCRRDFALLEGFNPNIRFTRTQTIMEGGDHCDFRFSLEKEG